MGEHFLQGEEHFLHLPALGRRCCLKNVPFLCRDCQCGRESDRLTAQHLSGQCQSIFHGVGGWREIAPEAGEGQEGSVTGHMSGALMFCRYGQTSDRPESHAFAARKIGKAR